MRLQASDGTLVRGRCAAPNLCDYCAKLKAVETARLLSLDAERGVAPGYFVVLSTRTSTKDPKPFYRGREKIIKALKRRYGSDVAYACLLEFTTGTGRRSGGLRRPHWNVLLKGIPLTELATVQEIIPRIWCSHVDAEPQGQYVELLESTTGAMIYVAAHFQKENQTPPKGWRGHRFTRSRNYLWLPTDEALRITRAELALDRELHKTAQAYLEQGLTLADAADMGIDVQAAAKASVAAKQALNWELVKVVVPKRAKTDKHDLGQYGPAFSTGTGEIIPHFSPYAA